MAVDRLFLLGVLAATGLAGRAATAEIIDHVSTSAMPSSYDGPCPVSIKLEGVVSFEFFLDTHEQYVYRWESGDRILTDDVVTLSRGRRNHVETELEIQQPVGKTVTMPIRLHAFIITRPVGDHFSLPVQVKVTCR